MVYDRELKFMRQIVCVNDNPLSGLCPDSHQSVYICDYICCGTGLIEIKCPFIFQNLHPEHVLNTFIKNLMMESCIHAVSTVITT